MDWPQLLASPPSNATHQPQVGAFLPCTMASSDPGDPLQETDDTAASTAPPADWTSEDERQLRDAGWQRRDSRQAEDFVKYWPEWTHPAWDPGIDVNAEGTMQRPSRVRPATSLRPAILPRDRGDAPSQYALYVRAADGVLRGCFGNSGCSWSFQAIWHASEQTAKCGQRDSIQDHADQQVVFYGQPGDRRLVRGPELPVFRPRWIHFRRCETGSAVASDVRPESFRGADGP